MARITTIVTTAVTALALIAIALWPTYIKHAENIAHAASLPTMAPVTADYKQRDKEISFWEGMVRKRNPEDMLSPRQVSAAYLQRYRERGDIGDVLRAEQSAELSLVRQPRGNIPGELQLASVYLTLHRFHEALALTKDVEAFDVGDDRMYPREASLDMEIGDYRGARRKLDAVKSADRDDSWRVIDSRYLELTGHLREARELLATATAYQNAVFDNLAQQRAWYFFREGEMAFEAGDNDAALADERQSLAIFPNYVDATRAAARFNCALERWNDCLSNAVASAAVTPYPETLGYEADAQRALGQTDAAQQTDDLIRTVERIGNTQRISDRLLAIYYSEHHLYPHDAYAIAKRELATRDDILTQDTLAWAAAMDGRWDEARTEMRKAIRFDTENSLMQYHAGVIALHFGDREQARRRFERALALNAHFHAVYAADARAQLNALRS
jgi:tetratricopeptide (TPR) repeat protein